MNIPQSRLLRTVLAGAATVPLAACIGGGGGGGGGNNTTESTNYEVTGFARDDSDVLAVAPAQVSGEPDLVVVRSDADADDYELHLLYPDGSTAVATVGFDDRVDSLVYTVADAEVTTTSNHGQEHRFDFANYDDVGGEVTVTYTGPDGTSITETVTADDGGDDDGGEEEPGDDLTGTWSVTEEVTSDSCDIETGNTYTDDYAIEQSGTSLTVTASDGSTYSGSLSGNNVNWSGSFPEDGGTTSLSLSATVAEDFNSISGTTDWSWENGEGDSCNGTSNFSASRVGGLSMMAVEIQDTDLLDETIDEALETLSDPFETYLPLNLYKQAADAVEDMADAAEQRFKEVRETVREGGNTLKGFGNSLTCLVSGARCAEVSADKTETLTEDLEAVDPQGNFDAGFEVSDNGITANRDEWDPLVASGEISTDFEMVETPCEESVFATMNPDCPQYEPPEDDGSGGDDSGGGDDGSTDDGGDTGGGSSAPTASASYTWVDPWGNGEDLTLPQASGDGWMDNLLNQCSYASSVDRVTCEYTDNEYSFGDTSVVFSNFTADPGAGGVPREAVFYRRCNFLTSDPCTTSELEYMTIEWANDGSPTRVRNKRGYRLFINDLRRWDVDGRPTGLSVYEQPFDSRDPSTRYETNIDCNYFEDGTDRVAVTETVWEAGVQVSDTTTTEDACPLPEGFLDYDLTRPNVGAAL